MELFNPSVAVASLGPLLAGMLLTVELTVIVIALSLAFGLLVALARLYGPRWLVWLVVEVVFVMAGALILSQILWIRVLRPWRELRP